MWNIFKVKNKDTRTTLLTSSVSIVDFKQVNAGWDRDSNPWKISMKMFSLANFQASFPLQVWFKNFERRCSWQKKKKKKKKKKNTFCRSHKNPLSDILKCYYKLAENGNIKSATSVRTGLPHRYLTRIITHFNITSITSKKHVTSLLFRPK